MWKCSHCGESVEDTFDICWNCGAAADGAVDSEFVAEPDDPSVTDPGPGPEDVVDRESDAPPVSGGPMNRRELATLFCKTLALVLFAAAAVMSLTAVMYLWFMTALAEDSVDSEEILLFLILAAPALAVLVVGIVYWKHAEGIASCMVSADPSPVAIEPFTLQDAMVVAFSTVGLVFFFDGIRDVVATIHIAVVFSATASEFWHHEETWSAIIQLALATWLILGSRGLVAVIHRLRTAGTPQENNKRDD